MLELWDIESKRRNQEREAEEYEDYFTGLARSSEERDHGSDAHLVAAWLEDLEREGIL